MEVGHMAKPEIMVIDENTKVLYAFESLLEAEGCVTIAAETGQEALLKIANRKPAVIFIDISIPDPNNLETIKKIREIQPFIPLILITSQNAHEAELLMEKFHASGYLKKPLSIKNIRLILKDLNLK